MELIEERLSDIETLLYAECGEAEKLEGEKLELLKKRLHMDWEPDPIYFTKTKLILCEILDYNRVTQLFSKVEEVMRLEMKTYNHYLYILDIAECGDLVGILSNEEQTSF